MKALLIHKRIDTQNVNAGIYYGEGVRQEAIQLGRTMDNTGQYAARQSAAESNTK